MSITKLIITTPIISPIIGGGGAPVPSVPSFSLVMDTTKTSDDSENNEFTIPTDGSSTYNYSVQWEDSDGNTGSLNAQTAGVTVAVPTAGEVTVEIRGVFPVWKPVSVTRYGIIDVLEWGEIEWSSMNSMFRNEIYFAGISATDTPDLSNVTNMEDMFRDCEIFNSDINDWDISNVTSITRMFSGASAFNQPLNNWDVTSLDNLDWVFYRAIAFNQDLDDWDISNVTNIARMFSGASAFNQDVSGWDTSNVINMHQIFRDATIFNQNIGAWDFSGISSGSNTLGRFVENTSLSRANYDALLIKLDGTVGLPVINDFAPTGLEYCSASAVTARSSLIAKGWTIAGDSLGAGC